MNSVGEAFLEFCSPPLRHVPGDLNVFRQRFPRLWQVLSALGVLLLVAGIFALFVPVPAVVKLGPAVFLLSGIGTALMAHTENRRFAAPVMPLVLMSGAAALHRRKRRQRKEAAPSAKEAAPSAKGAAPSAKGAASSAQGAAPSAKEAAPSAQGAAPSAQGAAPSAQGAAPSAQGAAPSAQG